MDIARMWSAVAQGDKTFDDVRAFTDDQGNQVMTRGSVVYVKEAGGSWHSMMPFSGGLDPTKSES